MAPERNDRLPPQSREAEQSVLGSMLRDNGVIGDVMQILRVDNFYQDAHQKIFQGIVHLYDKGHPVDMVLLANWLREQKYLDDIGGPSYLAELWETVATAANAEYYARIVRDRSIVRNLIHASTEILRDAYDQAQPADEMLEGAERKILDVAQMGITGQTMTLEQALAEAYDRIDQRHTGTEALTISGLSTGYVDLDEITAGLQNSELVIIAARPSVGKTSFALNLIRNIVIRDPAAVFFVSLEQSRIELAERLLCCQARVDSHKLRKGHLSAEDMQKLIDAGGVLRNTKLFIDDSPGQGMLRIAANARRLKLRHDIRLVCIDYLQLIEPDNRRDPRQEQVAQISRRLKFLARELKIPVIALAQVNRSSEDRQDHRPRLADLRESGCLVGDTLVTLADSRLRVPIRELAGRSGFQVWALDEVSYKLKPAEVSRAFCTGRKPVYRLETQLGRVVRATGNHPFRKFQDWCRLDELRIGDHIALPRVIPTGTATDFTPEQIALLGHLLGDGCTLPRHSLQYTTREPDLAQTVFDLSKKVFGDRLEPRISREREWYQVYLSAAERLTHGRRNPLAEWLDGLGAFGFRAWEKRVPPVVFRQSPELLTIFLRHLWVTDGCIKEPYSDGGYPSVYYASSSEGLCRDVQSLLLRFGINGVLRPSDQGDKGRMQYTVRLMGQPDLLRFADVIGTVGVYKSTALAGYRAHIASQKANTNRDVIPNLFWRRNVVPLMKCRGITMRRFQASLGMAFMGTGLYKQNVSRERMQRVAQAVGGDDYLSALATSDVYWDKVVSITPDGEEEVFDLTVPGPANFVAGDFISHNSIEQDADTVLLLHRPDRYEPGQHEGIVEVIIGKQRNGPTGEITLTYLKEFMRYEDFAVGGPFDG
jgi:replicative DNA helicase